MRAKDVTCPHCFRVYNPITTAVDHNSDRHVRMNAERKQRRLERELLKPVRRAISPNARRIDAPENMSQCKMCVAPTNTAVTLPRVAWVYRKEFSYYERLELTHVHCRACNESYVLGRDEVVVPRPLPEVASNFPEVVPTPVGWTWNFVPGRRVFQGAFGLLLLTLLVGLSGRVANSGNGASLHVQASAVNEVVPEAQTRSKLPATRQVFRRKRKIPPAFRKTSSALPSPLVLPNATAALGIEAIKSPLLPEIQQFE